MGREKVVFNWSSGKDSALALYRLQNDDRYEVSLLLTTVSEAYRRVSQHGVRVELLEMQAESLGIPLKKVWLPEELDMEKYGSIMKEALSEIGDTGISKAAFGDIFLEELRAYREKKLQEAGFEALFPIWNMDTGELARDFIDRGFSARVVCVNFRYLDKSFAGRAYDREFLGSLPETVDPCGENGEFHTFVHDGPIFKHPLQVKPGKIVHRKTADPPDDRENDPGSYTCSSPSNDGREGSGLWFCDLETIDHVPS